MQTLNSSDDAFDSTIVARVAQFYYREARLLDERRFLQWTELLSREVRYSIPLRFVPLAAPTPSNPDDMHAISNELSGYGPNALPLREETYGHLIQRATRALHPMAWAENPPARTCRFIGNVEVQTSTNTDLRVLSNFQVFYSQSGRADYIFAGHRRDVLERVGQDFLIASREVILNSDVIRGASVALFL